MIISSAHLTLEVAQTHNNLSLIMVFSVEILSVNRKKSQILTLEEVGQIWEQSSAHNKSKNLILILPFLNM